MAKNGLHLRHDELSRLRSSTTMETSSQSLNSIKLTETTSIKLVRNFFTAAFGCLAFLRGLLSDDHFTDDAFLVPQSNGQQKASLVRIKRLKHGVSESGDTLNAWIASLANGIFSCIAC